MIRDRWRESRPIALLYLGSLTAAILLAHLAYRDRVELGTAALVWGIPTLTGVMLGQLAYLVRLRTWIVLLLGILWVVSGYYGLASIVQADWFPGKQSHPLFSAGIGPTFLWYLTLWTPLYSLGGLFSLRRPWGVLACWFPGLFFLKASIPFINLDQEWLSGRKWSVWTPGTLLIVGAFVVFFLVFLGWRERRRLGRWQTVQTPQWKFTGRGRSRLRRINEVVAVILLMTASTAFYAPFLWNRIRDQKGTETQQGPGTDSSAKSDAGGSSQSGASPPTPSGTGSQATESRSRGGQEPPPQDPSSASENRGTGSSPSAPERPLEGVGRDVGRAARFLWEYLLLVLIVLLLARPAHRWARVRAWLNPRSETAPTQRIENAWKALRTVLADHGIRAAASESAVGFARRIKEQWKASPISLDSVLACALIRDRVRYGLFVKSSEVEDSRRLAQKGYRELWTSQSAWQKIRSLYRTRFEWEEEE